MNTLIDKWQIVKRVTANETAPNSMLSANNLDGAIRLDATKYNLMDYSKANYVALQAEGNGDAAKTFTITIYGGNEGVGLLEKVTVASMKLIDVASNTYGGTTFKAAAVISATDLHPFKICTSITDEVGRIYFDATGFKFLVITVDGLGGASGATSANVLMRAF